MFGKIGAQVKCGLVLLQPGSVRNGFELTFFVSFINSQWIPKPI
jgi:hypothetical protein